MRSVRLRPVTPLGILVEKLGTLRERLGATGADATFADDLEACERLAAGLEPYVESCTSPESPALRDLAAQTRDEDWHARFARGETAVELEGEMLSGHIEGRLLATLVHAMRATRVLEIGLFTGYSALAMAEALPDDGVLVACEVDAYAASRARRAFDATPHGAKIAIEVGDAASTLRRFANATAPFDLVFIDADKPSYRTYVELVLAGGLLAPHGLVCIDNTLMQGQPYLSHAPSGNGAAIAAFNRFLRDDPRVVQVLVPVRDGLTIVRRA